MAAHPVKRKSSHNSSHRGSKGILRRAIREVTKKPPSTLKPGQSRPKRRRQLLAIAFSKARRAGARLPKKR